MSKGGVTAPAADGSARSVKDRYRPVSGVHTNRSLAETVRSTRRHVDVQRVLAADRVSEVTGRPDAALPLSAPPGSARGRGRESVRYALSISVPRPTATNPMPHFTGACYRGMRVGEDQEWRRRR